MGGAIPQTRWAETVDGLDIAYQVFGDGPPTIVILPPWLSHVEIDWELPPYAVFLRQLASFARVVMPVLLDPSSGRGIVIGSL